MDKIRDKLREGMRKAGFSEFALSKALNRNPAYINQFLTGKQKSLPHEDRVKIVEVLKMRPEDLDLVTTTSPLPKHAGLAEDAEPYTPGQEGYLSSSPHIAFFRMRSNALDQHPDRIRPGTLLAFDINDVNTAKFQTGSIVVAQCLDRRDMLKSHGTIIRMFIAPNKLVTNSSGANEIISLDDETLPYVVVIRGRLKSIVSELN